jgi:hypothetical protein
MSNGGRSHPPAPSSPPEVFEPCESDAGEDANLPANARYRLPTDPNPLDCSKLLGKMGVVEQGVLGPRQGHDLLPELLPKSIGRPSARIAVHKRPGTIARNHTLETLGMSIANLHPSTCLSQGETPLQYHSEKMPPSPLPLPQAHSVSHNGDILPRQLKGT